MLTQLPRCTCVKHALVSVIASQHRAKESYTVQENSCGKCIGGGGGEGSEAAGPQGQASVSACILTSTCTLGVFLAAAVEDPRAGQCNA